jgi:MscS family membrane protein
MLWFFLVLCSSITLAGELPNCDNPRDAADTLLALLQPEDYRPDQAAACLDMPPGAEARGPKVAIQLKQVLDARGHFVPVPDLPADADWRPEVGDEVVLVEALPVVYLKLQSDGRWLWSRETVNATPALHAETFNGFGAWVQSTLPPSFSTTQIGAYRPWQGVVLGLLLLIGGLASLLVNTLLRRRMLSWVGRLGLPLNADLLAKTRGPMRTLCFGAVLLWGVSELQLGIQPSQVLLFAARVIVSLSVVMIALRWVDVFAEVFERRAQSTDSRMDDQALPLVEKLVKIAIVGLGLVFVLQNVGVDVGSLIAGLGIGGLAFALGAQDTLSNLFGSLMIFLDRPFQVGDWVVIDGSSEGEIEEIGFRSTRVRTGATSLITVPNSKVAQARIENFSARSFRRQVLTLGLTYDTPNELIQAYTARLEELIEAHPATRDGAKQVYLNAFSASSLDIHVLFYLDVPGRQDELIARGELLLGFKQAAEEVGVAFAFPSTSLYVESLPDRG